MMFSKELPWRRTFTELVLRGAVSLLVCALAALCVGGLLSTLAANLRPTGGDANQAACNSGSCTSKGKGHGPRLASKPQKRVTQ
jgi:hypothetical protein